jgi:hypothetical protein
MSLGTTVKDPADVIDVTVDVSAFIGEADSVASATWTTSPAGPTFGTPVLARASSTCRISGGTAATTYTITVTTVSAKGITVRRSFSLQVAVQ